MDFSLDSITSAIQSGADAVTQFANGIGGGIMGPAHQEPDDILGKTRLKLGDVEFTDLELPQSIRVMLKQKLAQHDLVGGTRVIDTMGAFYEPIGWTGRLEGLDAVARDKILSQMLLDAQEVVLTWDEYAFRTVIEAYESTYHDHAHIDYTLTCAVLAATDVPQDPPSDDLNQQINDDMNDAGDLAEQSGDSGIQSAISTVQDAINQVQDFATATVQQVQAIIQPIVQAQQAVQGAILRTEAALVKITTLGGLVPGNPVAAAVGRLSQQVNTINQLPVLYRLQEVVGRTQANLSAMPRFAQAVKSAAGTTGNAAGTFGQGARTVTQAGGTLYQIASDQYGDSTLWPYIAEANGMTDPQLDGMNTIIVPDAPPAGSSTQSAFTGTTGTTVA